MFMKKFKFKMLIVMIFVLSLNQHSLDIFADEPTQNESTILDGEIGEWDPDLNDNPNFDNEEVDGHIPKDNEYYTISVTVPVNMEFLVLHSSQLVFGKFISPMYTIKNNGSKNLSVSLDSFVREDSNIDDLSTPLYIERINSKDNRTQMELKMYGVEDFNRDEIDEIIDKEIDLTKINQLSDAEKKLYELGANEKKGIKFYSDRWELPQVENNKEKAMSNFNAGFIFSIVR